MAHTRPGMATDGEYIGIGRSDGAVVSYAAGGSVGLSSGLEIDMVTFL
jgi:hypothetical protein